MLSLFPLMEIEISIQREREEEEDSKNMILSVEYEFGRQESNRRYIMRYAIHITKIIWHPTPNRNVETFNNNTFLLF